MYIYIGRYTETYTDIYVNRYTDRYMDRYSDRFIDIYTEIFWKKSVSFEKYHAGKKFYLWSHATKLGQNIKISVIWPIIEKGY